MAYRALLLSTLLLSTILVLAQSQAPVMTSPTDRSNNPFPNDPGFPNATGKSVGMMNRGEINGNVRSLDDHPVADVQVQLLTSENGTTVGSVYSSPSGNFELDNIPPGQYELVARAGLAETREHVEVRGMKSFVTLRLPQNSGTTSGNGEGGSTVSVTEMKVPEKARKALEKARDAFAKGKRDEARTQVEAALKIEPAYAGALTLRALLSLDNAQLDAARADLETAVQSDPNDGMAQVVLGSTYNALHRPEDALRVLDRAASLLPNSWQVYFERARALISKHGFAEALRNLDKAQQFVTHDFPVMHLVKANALLGLQQYPEAKAELQAFLDRVPQGDNADEARRVLQQLNTATASASNR